MIGFLGWRRVGLERGRQSKNFDFEFQLFFSNMLIQQLRLRTSWECERLWLVEDSSSSEDSSES